MDSRTFTAGWLVAAAVLSSWAVSSASEQPVRRLSGAGQAAVALPDLSMEVDTEIARLSTRVLVVATPVSPGRDPFRLSARRRVGSVSIVARAAAVSKFPSASVGSEREESLREADALPDVAKQPTLSGVAELSAGAFTAVISFAGDLHYARTGDVIAGRYRIDAIAIDGADVFDLVLGTISRLKLHA